MIAVEMIIYVVVGGLAGLIAGLLGISGGVVTVPCLLLVFKLLHFPQAYIMHLAIGTSLAAMIFNSLSSAWSHNRRGSVMWDVVRHMAPGIIVGSIIGALIAHVLSGIILEIIFGVFLIILGVYFFLPYKEPEDVSKLPSTPVLSAIGGVIGAISNILGIGGGIITVPILMQYKVSAKKSIGTSAATGTLVTVIGAVSYLYFGLGDTKLGETIGYLYLPAFAIIAVVSFFVAPFGVKLSHQLPAKILRRIFGCALFATGVVMIVL